MKPTVVITETLAQICADWLSEHAQVVWCSHDAPGFEAALARADALVVRTYTQVDQALLDRAPQLKVVGRAGVGLDNFDLPACAKHNIPVVYTPDANTQAVVEYVLGLMLDHYRPRTALPTNADAATFHQLRKTQVGTQLDQMTLGIVGFGRIGKRLGAVAHALGINLLVTDLLPQDTLEQAVDYPFTFVDHPTLCQQSHIVTIHVDGRPDNRHFFDAPWLAHLRDDVLLINAARGMLVDHDALTRWASDHLDAHIFLDVHDPEPPEPNTNHCPNITLLPHLASRTNTALENMSWVVRDVVRVLQDQPPQHQAF